MLPAHLVCQTRRHVLHVNYLLHYQSPFADEETILFISCINTYSKPGTVKGSRDSGWKETENLAHAELTF